MRPLQRSIERASFRGRSQSGHGHHRNLSPKIAVAEHLLSRRLRSKFGSNRLFFWCADMVVVFTFEFSFVEGLNRDDDLAQLLVRLHILVCLTDLAQWKGLRDEGS